MNVNFTPIGAIKEVPVKKINKKNLFYFIPREKDFPYLSIGILVVTFFMAILAPFITPYDPSYIDFSNIYMHPSSNHILGTDGMGRDIFARILYGSRISMLIGIMSVVISMFIGIVYGSISGYFNKLDDIMMRFLDIMLSVPSIIIMTLIQSITGSDGAFSIAFVIAVTSWMNIAKIVRSEVLEIKNRDFVCASKIMGASFIHISIKHFLPNFVPAVIYMICINCANAIITESTLSFLGLGLNINIPSLGIMLMDAQKGVFLNKWWESTFPGLMIILIIFAIVNIGEYIRIKNNKKIENI